MLLTCANGLANRSLNHLSNSPLLKGSQTHPTTLSASLSNTPQFHFLLLKFAFLVAKHHKHQFRSSVSMPQRNGGQSIIFHIFMCPNVGSERSNCPNMLISTQTYNQCKFVATTAGRRQRMLIPRAAERRFLLFFYREQSVQKVILRRAGKRLIILMITERL